MDVVRRVAPAVIMTVALTVVGCLGLQVGVLGSIDLQAQDLLQPGAATSDEVVVIGIDRAALASAGGTWPWPRRSHAALLRAIAEAGPTVVVYDVLLADAADGDPELAGAIGAVPTVLAESLALRPAGEGPARVVDRIEPTGDLADAAFVAHANVRVEERAGVIRTLPFYAADDRGVPVPSLALAAVQAVDGALEPVIERPGGVQVGDRLIPLEDGDLRINWSDTLTADDVIPASAVLAGDVDPARFAGKTVVVGVDEPTLGDLHLTPLDRSGSMPGVLIHANAINTVLGSAYLEPVSSGSAILLLVGVVAILSVAFVVFRLRIGMALTLAALASLAAWSSWWFHRQGQLWPLVWPVVVVFLTAAVGTALRYVTELRHRRRAQTLFARYVPDAVIAEMTDAGLLERLAEARSVDVTVVFCDLRGFTAVAEVLDPVDVRRLLDRFYEYAVGIVHAAGGTVMQFVGDEVFAAFGAPLPDDDRRPRALRVAREMVDRVDELDAALTAEGLPTVRFGVGVNDGRAVAAHVGTADRLQYTVIGDTVNVGSRLCSWAAVGQVVASPWTVEGSGCDDLVPAEVVELKGVSEAVRLQRYTAPYGDPAEQRIGK